MQCIALPLVHLSCVVKLLVSYYPLYFITCFSEVTSPIVTTLLMNEINWFSYS